jgi:hypothetical protein
MSGYLCYTPYQLFTSYLAPELTDVWCYQELTNISQTPSFYIPGYLLVFLFTNLLEGPFYLMALKGTWKENIKRLFILNFSTHPIVCFLIPLIATKLSLTQADALLTGEFLAPFIEFLICYLVFKMKPVKAIILCVVANTFSWWTGLYLLNYIYN